MEARQPAGGKWVARAIYGLLLLVVLTVGWWALSESAPEAPAAEVTQPAPTAPPPPLPSLDRERDEPPPIAAVAEATEPPAPSAPSPSPAPRPSLPTPSTPRPPKHPVDADAFARESELIARARAELPSTPETALKTLAEHQQAFPAGALKRDAELMRVEALLRLGRREEAEKLGRKLVSRDQGVGRDVERLLRDVPSN